MNCLEPIKEISETGRGALRDELVGEKKMACRETVITPQIRLIYQLKAHFPRISDANLFRNVFRKVLPKRLKSTELISSLGLIPMTLTWLCFLKTKADKMPDRNSNLIVTSFDWLIDWLIDLSIYLFIYLSNCLLVSCLIFFIYLFHLFSHRYELRVIVWNTKDVKPQEINFLGEEMSDIFVKW